MGHSGPIALRKEVEKLINYGNRVEQMRRDVEARSTVRCADCWQWIDADKNHTCRAQVRRNQKAEKK